MARGIMMSLTAEERDYLWWILYNVLTNSSPGNWPEGLDEHKHQTKMIAGLNRIYTKLGMRGDEP